MGEPRPAPQDHNLTAVFDDATAFRSWYESTLPRVYAYLYARCDGDPALAEELTQQTFVAVLGGHRKFRGDAEPMTWVISIARRKLVDHFRSEKRARARHERLVTRHEASHDETATWIVRSGLDEARRALDQLPGEQRIAFVLRHVDGLSVRDVAHTIGRSADATESLLRRARVAFDAARAGVHGAPR